MYELWHCKENFEMKISPMTVSGHKYIESGKVSFFNDCYYICEDRKMLRDFAVNLKQKWMNEIEEKLEKVNNMKIKNKYK